MSPVFVLFNHPGSGLATVSGLCIRASQTVSSKDNSGPLEMAQSHKPKDPSPHKKMSVVGTFVTSILERKNWGGGGPRAPRPERQPTLISDSRFQ